MSTSWFSRRTNTPQSHRTRTRRRPLVESLEGRQLLATFTVTNVNDAGAGSLRQAILSSNAIGGAAANTIKFSIGAGLQIISPKSALPTITHAVTLDATTQPGKGTMPRIVLDGTLAGSATTGLTVKAPNVTVKGLAIDDFAGGGVLVSGGLNDIITGDFIGVAASGNVAKGNRGFGVELAAGAQGVTVSNDVISGNAGSGVLITGTGTKTNTVSGSFLGTDSTGTKALPNTAEGVRIDNGATANTIGGLTTAARDVISGNLDNGVLILASSNVVEGDFIGTDSTGTRALGNHVEGVTIAGANNTVGGMSAAARDVISGNFDGVDLQGGGTSGNLIEGDFIGTDSTGTRAVGNASAGVLLFANATSNTIGPGDVISGNGVYGVQIADPGTAGNVVVGDFIGTDLTGTHALPNVDGVAIMGGANKNTVGGTTSASRNVISGNTLDGVQFSGAATTGNLVEGDFLGVDVTGAHALGNHREGVLFQGGSSGNTVGGTTAAARNVISGNGNVGVEITDSGKNNLIEGDFIGTDATGKLALGNTNSGVMIITSANNTVGGTSAGARNIISGNGVDGVQIDYALSTGNLVEGNYIGTDVTGQVALANARDGIYLWAGASGNTIGGSAAGAGNVISGNAANGVIIDAGSPNNVVAGNVIGLKAGGEGILPNGGDGVLITNGSNGNTIGGSAFGDRNLISGNRGNGVRISGSSGNTVAGDYVGLDMTGNFAQGNTLDGVRIEAGSSNNTVGGTVMGTSRNAISANGQYGVDITGSGTSNNQVIQNNIGTVANGAGPLGNGFFGVAVVNGASGNTIGAANFNLSNLIEYNLGGGVFIAGATNTTVQDDIIELNGQGQPTPMIGDGVFIADSTSTFVVSCTIEANRDWGILMTVSPTTTLSLNYIINNGVGGVTTV